MDGMPKQIWANAAVFGNGEPLAGEWNYRDVGSPDDTPYVRADLAQAPAPVLWTQAQQLAFARAYDTEDASQRGEPTPWVDGEDTGEWVDERVACVRAGLAALDTPDAHPTNMQKVHNAPDAGVVAELVEAARGLKGIVEEIQGAMEHGTWRDEKGQRLKDTPEWVTLYNALAKLAPK